jgi:hypothetical protein
MKKIDLGQTITVLANLGVIAGIIFLVIEIQQNTRTLQFEAYQSLIGQIGGQNQLNIENPEFATRFNDLVDMSEEELAREDLSPVEYTPISNFLFLLTRHGDLAYYQYELGMLSEDRLISTLRPVSVRWCSALYRDWWTSRSFIFAPSYRKFVDSALSEC